MVFCHVRILQTLLLVQSLRTVAIWVKPNSSYQQSCRGNHNLHPFLLPNKGILLKIVFLAGYYNELKKQEIKNHINTVFKFYFIDRSEEFEDMYSTISEKTAFDFPKFIDATNKTFQSIYGASKQKGGSNQYENMMDIFNVQGFKPFEDEYCKAW